MAALEIKPTAVYSNKHMLLLSECMRMVFIDARENAHGVAQTETAVAEIIMTRSNAEFLANEILRVLAQGGANVESHRNIVGGAT